MTQQNLNDALTALGFAQKGGFEPIEVDADDFDNMCEIGSWIVAIQKNCIALLNYIEMEYWDIADGSIKIALQAIAAISEYEIKRVAQRGKNHDS